MKKLADEFYMLFNSNLETMFTGKGNLIEEKLKVDGAVTISIIDMTHEYEIKVMHEVNHALGGRVYNDGI